MMSRYPISAVALFLAATASGFPLGAGEQRTGTAEHPPFPPDTYAIQFLLRGAADRSPDHYLVALVEIASEPACEGPEDKRLCTCAARVIDLLSAKVPPGQPHNPTEIRLITGSHDSSRGGSRAGSRYLVVVVPYPGKPGVYGSTAMVSGPSEVDVEQARHELKNVVTK